MHSVSRSLLVAGIMALGALTACGDKVEIAAPVTPTPAGKDTSVQSVSVSPTTAQIPVGGTQLFVANVVGGKDLTNRNVTWSSSNTAVATVDANGVATAKAAGQTSIIATSAANSQVRGVAVLTVSAVTPASLSFFGVNNQFGQPANVSNAGNQLNIIANVDPGQSGLRTLQLIGVGCRTGIAGDTAVIGTAPISGTTGTQTGQQVTIAFPTTALGTNGLPIYTNGNCQLAIRGLDASGAVIPGTLTSGPLVVLNNADVVYGTITAPKTASDPAGLNWTGGGAVTGTVTPVTYTRGRSFAGGTISLCNATAFAGPLPGTGCAVIVNPVTGGNLTVAAGTATNGTFTVTFPYVNPATVSTNPTGNTWGVTNANTGLLINLVDNNGNATGTAIVATQASTTLGAPVVNTVRLDNQVPLTPLGYAVANAIASPAGNINFAALASQYGTVAAGTGFITSGATFPTTVANNSTQRSFFALSSAQLTAWAADNGGVDKLTVTYEYTTNSDAEIAAGTATWTALPTDLSTLATGSSTAYAIRATVCDALQNCARQTQAAGVGTAVTRRFGVDVAVPTITTTVAQPNNQAISTSAAALAGTANAPGTLTLSVLDPANPNGTNGSGFGANPLRASLSRLAFNAATGVVETQCYDPANTLGAAAFVNGEPAGFVSLTTLQNLGLAGSTCPTITYPGTSLALPTFDGQYSLTYQVRDLAGNLTPAVTTTYYIDATAPAVSGGVAIPAAVTTNSQFSSTATDNMDVAAGAGMIAYVGPALRFTIPATASPTGVAFDQTLTRSSTVTVTANPFFRSLTTAVGVAGTKPDSITLRATDVAGNTGFGANAQQVAIPASNVSTQTTNPYVGAALTSVAVTFSQNPVTNGALAAGVTAVNPTSTSLNADVTVPGTNNTPFAQVCFFYQNTVAGLNGAAAGEYVLIGCQQSAGVTISGGNRIYRYTQAGFNPPDALGAGALNVIAVGVDANGDAFASAPAALTMTNP